ncbi:MFS transporter [Rhodococcus sp. WS1]|uniref:MFS transporter n=1 Tax=unclassified Rhodococcus (in: high G+C Gram-positive bacteria) TaxID=192944 RepID=UPI0011413E0A|nr:MULTISPECIES: MFS transporter [unclassified Rhodococcus (in: high G+C Gram-positive bacteria)]ROZ52889.1 MFS transporter [Rhodococcus sp. WS1]TQC35981.1 MFS transporter [Rhodococcus sp. WS7]
MSTNPDSVTVQPPRAPDRPGSKNTNTRVAIASLVGTLVEGYDLVLYGLAAALVFPHVFFPALGQAAGTVASLATLGVAFVARPFGALLFGHFGDKLGRKKTLVATLLMMGLSSAIMGMIPSANQIGVIAPILIVILRIFQGLAAGGEWAGATSFVAEHAPPGKRGFYAMFPQLGHALPQAVSSATFLLVGLTMSEEAFLGWGWRLPFLFSIVLIGVGLYIRLQIEETPVFKKEAGLGTSRRPIVEAFKTQPREIFKGIGVALTMFSLFYVATAFLAAYGTNTLGFSRNQVLVVGLLAGVCYATATAVSSVMSDRVGRKRMLVGAQIVGVAWAMLLFPIIGTGSYVGYAVAVCITTTVAGFAYGPVGAFLPEQFHTRYRYSATGFAYSLTGVVGGGIVPLLAPIIIGSAGTMVFGVFLAMLCGISAACTFSLRDIGNDTLDSV